MDAVRKEVDVDRVEIKIDIDAVFAPDCYVLYQTDNYSGTVICNRHPKLSDEEDIQLAAIMSILCNQCCRSSTLTRVPLKRPSVLQATEEEKKKKDFLTNFCV